MIKGKKYYHYASVMSIIGDGPKLTLGFEICTPRRSQSCDEGELVASKRLISDVVGTFRNFIDVVVYDSLVCNFIWINTCQDLGLDLVVRVKKKITASDNSRRKLTNRIRSRFEHVKIYESEFAWKMLISLSDS